MQKPLNESVMLSNGVEMPWLGLGVYKSQEGEEVENAVLAAIQAGYRSIDTAALYQNEVGVGRAIAKSGVPREDLFITTKVWNTDQGYESTLEAFEQSRAKLSLDYVDLYLVHWPVADKYKETWRALEKLYRDGKVRAIGVSNFQPHHLQDLMKDSKVTPMVNQVEFHPLLTQKEVLTFCQNHNIRVEAWAPLMRGGLMDHEVITQIAQKHGKTPAQVVLRWDLQHGVVTIPKSVRAERIIENSQIFDFSLTTEEMQQIDSLNQNKRTGADPDNFNF